jgi:NAD(P)H-hydrate repair Nnr-like enzyme with NAD(P)H-hydrate dehydratase domain
MAVGGTGDVLTGVIAALIAQWVATGPAVGRAGAGGEGQGGLELFDAVRIAVYAHGLAGERWAAERSAPAGLLATELADEMPRALTCCTRERGPGG